MIIKRGHPLMQVLRLMGPLTILVLTGVSLVMFLAAHGPGVIVLTSFMAQQPVTSG